MKNLILTEITTETAGGIREIFIRIQDCLTEKRQREML